MIVKRQESMMSIVPRPSGEAFHPEKVVPLLDCIIINNTTTTEKERDQGKEEGENKSLKSSTEARLAF